MNDIVRKLASIRKIDAIDPIPGADAIECASVGGWKVVVKKGEFHPGDLAAYFEIDSWIPTAVAPFLSKGKEPRVYNGVQGERLRTIKLRGQISQGLLLPLDKFVEEGLKSGLVQYDDEKPAVEDECEECGDTVDDVLNARATNYGKFIEGAEIMQMTKRLVHNYIEQRGTSLAFDQLEAIDMIIHKLGRIINGNPDKVDHWTDIAGYAKLVADRLEGNVR